MKKQRDELLQVIANLSNNRHSEFFCEHYCDTLLTVISCRVKLLVPSNLHQILLGWSIIPLGQ